MRGQIWSMDFALSFTLFVGMMVLFFFTFNNFVSDVSVQRDLAVMQNNVLELTEALIRTPGIPTNWDSSNVHVIGLADQDNILNSTKVLNFLSLNYSTMKRVMGIGSYDFNLTIEYPNGTLVPVFSSVNSTEDLSSYWNLDEGSENITVDSFGPNNGTLGDDVGECGGQYCPAWADGKYGSALDFRVAPFLYYEQYVDLGTFDLSGTEVTITAWFRADDFGDPDGRIIAKANGEDAVSTWWMISTVDDGGDIKLRFRLRTTPGITSTLDSSHTLTAGQWIHVAAVYDGSNMILYKNGTFVGSTPKVNPISQNNGVSVWMGQNPDGNAEFDGKIDDVRIYSRALSQEEIISVMNMGEITYTPTETAAGTSAEDSDLLVVVERLVVLDGLNKLKFILWK